MDILKRARELQSEVVADRRYLHQHPELSFDLPETSAYVKKRLREMGYEPQDIGQCGVTALVGGKRPGKCILIRADMDALPMKEESGLPFAAACDDKAHTCGHDTHTAMLLGAAKILKEMEDEIPGTIKLMFQPSEEFGTGAEALYKAGILENPHVDAAFGVHTIAALPCGQVCYAKGPMFASCDSFNITVTGKGGHGSQPNTAIDPVNIAAHIVVNLNTILAREVAPDDFAVMTVGCIQSGTINNIIPSEALIRGTIRSYDPKVRNFMCQRMQEVAKETAATFRAEARNDWFANVPPVYTDDETMEILGEGVKAVLGTEWINDKAAPFTGTEDFGFITGILPSGFFLLGAQPEEGEAMPQHNPKIIFNEDAFPNGVTAYVAGALAWLKAQA